MDEVFYYIAKSIEIVSFSIMTYGILLAVFLFLKNEAGRFTGRYHLFELNKIRIDFGYYILLGLEFLIAADIIQTILKPTNEELLQLGAIVAIRIALSFFLTREIDQLRESAKENKKGIN